MAIYANYSEVKSQTIVDVYIGLTYISGILYYLSTAINPILYNIMSHKFREAFKSTPAQLCGRRGRRVSVPARSYSILSRGGNTRLVTEGAALEANRDPDPEAQRPPVGRLSRLRFAPEPLVRASTISNSSLQDLDEPEYTGTELAHYMGQLNTR
ncbi:hypothetical protein AAG570_002141 [Ranatra chinensis]|uniref:Uncharacterized protein n=1 Tax=Ranatra chinensis TaxID=642074 RepID=A0ABD0YTD2_9HEMI